MPIPRQVTPLRNAMFTSHLSLRTEPLCQSWGGKGQQPASLGVNALLCKWALCVMKGESVILGLLFQALSAWDLCPASRLG